MAFMTETEAAVEGLKEQLGTCREQLEDHVRQGRRAAVRARLAAEDGAAAVALQVRRRPLGAIAIAAGSGVLLGGLIGFALGREAR